MKKLTFFSVALCLVILLTSLIPASQNGLQEAGINKKIPGTACAPDLIFTNYTTYTITKISATNNTGGTYTVLNPSNPYTMDNVSFNPTIIVYFASGTGSGTIEVVEDFSPYTRIGCEPYESTYLSPLSVGLSTCGQYNVNITANSNCD